MKIKVKISKYKIDYLGEYQEGGSVGRGEMVWNVDSIEHTRRMIINNNLLRIKHDRPLGKSEISKRAFDFYRSGNYDHAYSLLTSSGQISGCANCKRRGKVKVYLKIEGYDV